MSSLEYKITEMSFWKVPEQWQNGLSDSQEKKANEVHQKLQGLVNQTLRANPEKGMPIGKALKIRKNQNEQLKSLEVLISRKRDRGQGDVDQTAISSPLESDSLELERGKRNCPEVANETQAVGAEVEELLVVLQVASVNDGIEEAGRLKKRLVKAIDRAERAEVVAKQHYDQRLMKVRKSMDAQVEDLEDQLFKLKDQLKACQKELVSVENQRNALAKQNDLLRKLN